jgi:high affinity sulfate transporter 1
MRRALTGVGVATEQVTGGPAPATHKKPRSVLQGLVPLDRARLPIDALAGVTLAALAIPEVMGYTSIAGMPVITGLYTLVLPIFAFALLGSSRHLVVGADSATAAVMAAGLAGMAASGSPHYVALAGLLALLAAGWLLLARLCRLGFIADFLSRTVLIGFLTGVGIQVAFGQVGGILGIPEGSGVTINGHKFTGSLAKLASTLKGLDQISWATVAVSAGVLGFIVVVRMVNHKIPGALIAVIGAIVVSWAWDLSSHGVAILGPVPSGLPSLGLPNVTWSDIPPLAGTSLSIFVLILAQSAATSRAYAAKYNEDFSENWDLIGLATANGVAGLSGTFVVNGSPTKTQMVDGAGGQSQFAQLTTGVIVIVVLLFLTGPLKYMPEAVLASIVFMIGIELISLPGLRAVYRLRRDEFVVAVLTAVTVIVAGVEQGIILAIVVSLIDHLRFSYHPYTRVMVPNDQGPGWHRDPVSPDVRTAPGLVIYRFGGSLYYANASHLLQDVRVLVSDDDRPLRWFCLDAAAIPDVDYTGGETLKQVNAVLGEHATRFVISDPTGPVRRELIRYGIVERIGDDAIYPDMIAVYRAYQEATEPRR